MARLAGRAVVTHVGYRVVLAGYENDRVTAAVRIKRSTSQTVDIASGHLIDTQVIAFGKRATDRDLADNAGYVQTVTDGYHGALHHEASETY
jgi:hypothetical protein